MQRPRLLDFGLTDSSYLWAKSAQKRFERIWLWSCGAIFAMCEGFLIWRIANLRIPASAGLLFLVLSPLGAIFLTFFLLLPAGALLYVLAATFRRLLPVFSKAEQFDRALADYQVWRRQREKDAIRSQENFWRNLTATEFEQEVHELLKRYAYESEMVGGPNDGGVDVVVNKNSRKVILQCKANDKKYPVGPKVVRELIGAIEIEGAARGILVSRSGFTRGALQTAANAKHIVRLWDLQRLIRLSIDAPNN